MQDLDDLTPAEMNSIAPPAPIYKIVLTGGPCGGKTTALARVSLSLHHVDLDKKLDLIFTLVHILVPTHNLSFHRT